MNHDRSIYRERLGDPSAWTGDWRRPGKYLSKEQQHATQARMRTHHRMLIGMAIRGAKSSVIAAILSVSREAVDRRLRPLGLKNAPGHFGRPPAGRVVVQLQACHIERPVLARDGGDLLTPENES